MASDESARNALRDKGPLTHTLAETWAEERGVALQEEETPLGEALLFENKVGILLNPRGTSSSSLRELQHAWRLSGRNLYYVYEWEMNSLLLLNHFASKLGLDDRKYAAKRLSCDVVSNKVGDAFMKENHIQGSARGVDKISLALQEPNTKEILAVQQFSRYRWGSSNKAKVSESSTWEGLRLCFLPGVQIYGGASRLEKAFEDRCRPKKIVSYVNLSHSDGEYKRHQGFVEETDPRQSSYMWVLEGQPKMVPIKDRQGAMRKNDLAIALKNPYINPNRLAGSFGIGVGQLFYGGKLGSRKELRAHPENGTLVHNDAIMEAIGYLPHYTSGQAKWVKDFS